MTKSFHSCKKCDSCLKRKTILDSNMGQICSNCENDIHCENAKICACSVCNDHDTE